MTPMLTMYSLASACFMTAMLTMYGTWREQQ
jgi:hypothetical protein